jgi:membrane protein implicated in regulation of membrane protease activity
MVYLVAYLWIIDAQEGAAAWWYVGLMVLAALSFAAAALGTWARPALTVGLVISAVAMLVALLSLGALLAPTVVAAALALVVTRPAQHVRRRTNHNRVSNEGMPASRS